MSRELTSSYGGTIGSWQLFSLLVLYEAEGGDMLGQLRNSNRRGKRGKKNARGEYARADLSLLQNLPDDLPKKKKKTLRTNDRA